MESSAGLTSELKRKLSDNLERVRNNIAESAARVGRDPSSIILVAVTKSVGLDVVRALLELGQTELGENRVQQLVQRAGIISEQLARMPIILHGKQLPRPNWHMIGHLQRNKVKSLLPVVSLIHSVDNLRLVEEINNRAKKINKVQDILIEVNCSGEPQKFGLQVAAVGHFIDQISTLEFIRVRGLMTMAAMTDDPEQARPTFERLYEIFLETKMEFKFGKGFEHLSMGMSQDYQVAVESGATIVRIGSALFEGIPLQDNV